MRPSLGATRTRDPVAATSHRPAASSQSQARTPRASFEWINPAINQHFQLTSKPYTEGHLEPNTIINELMDHNSDIVNMTINPLDLSVSYVKSILPSAGAEQRQSALSVSDSAK